MFVMGLLNVWRSIIILQQNISQMCNIVLK